MRSPAKNIALDKFLADLPKEASEEINGVVATMMRNEQIALRLRGIELELRPFFIAAVFSFFAGVIVLIFYSEPGGFLDRVAGAWPLLTASLGFLPIFLTYYAIRIRKRSQADIHNFDLNKEFFLPHGAIYFPSDAGLAEQMVTLVEVKPPPPKSKYDLLKPGTIW